MQTRLSFSVAQPVAAGSGPTLTQHAAARIQQRGIPAWFVGLLLDHGRSHHDGNGAVIRTVDRATRRHLRTELTRSEYAAAERYFCVYAVVASDQAVITAARRSRRKHLH